MPSKTEFIFCDKPDFSNLQLHKVMFFATKDSSHKSWISLDVVNYQHLANNNAAILAHLKKQKMVLNYLDSCIERYNYNGNNQTSTRE